MTTLLNSHESNEIYNEVRANMELTHSLELIKLTGAKFGSDGDQFYYGFGDLPEPTSIYGFGKTPASAAISFQQRYYSTTLKPTESFHVKQQMDWEMKEFDLDEWERWQLELRQTHEATTNCMDYYGVDQFAKFAIPVSQTE